MSTILVLAAFGVPLLLWLVWLSSERVLYKGVGSVYPIDFGVRDPEGQEGTCQVTVLVPDRAVLPATASRARAESLHGRPADLEVDVRKRFLSPPWVETITWGPRSEPEPTGDRSQGLFLALYYLGLGIFLVFQAQLLPAALSVGGAGFVMTAVARRSDLTGMTVLQLGHLVFWLFASGLLSFFLLGEPSLITGLFGFLFTLVFGQVLGLLARAWWQQSRLEDEPKE